MSNNYLTVLSANTLGVDPAFTPTATWPDWEPDKYTDDTVDPMKVSLFLGQRILLESPGDPNDGALVTVKDVASAVITVFETLSSPDSASYDFKIMVGYFNGARLPI